MPTASAQQAMAAAPAPPRFVESPTAVVSYLKSHTVADQLRLRRQARASATVRSSPPGDVETPVCSWPVGGSRPARAGPPMAAGNFKITQQEWPPPRRSPASQQFAVLQQPWRRAQACQSRRCRRSSAMHLDARSAKPRLFISRARPLDSRADDSARSPGLSGRGLDLAVSRSGRVGVAPVHWPGAGTISMRVQLAGSRP